MKNYIDIYKVVEINNNIAKLQSLIFQEFDDEFVEIENKDYKVGDLIAKQQLDLPNYINWFNFKKIKNTKKIKEQIEKKEIRILKQIRDIDKDYIWFGGEDFISLGNENFKCWNYILEIWNAESGRVELIKKHSNIKLGD